MAFGKYRDGPTALGRLAANWIQDGDNFSFQTRRRPGGVVVRKSGEFTNIFQDKQGIDGFYSLGNVPGIGTRIVGSADGFSFTDRGPAPVTGGFTVTQLGFFGKGLGEVVTSESLGAYVDFDGKNCQALQFKFQHTRNGRSLKPYYDIPSFIPFGAWGALEANLRGGYWNDGTGHKFFHLRSVPVMIDGQHIQAIVVDNGIDAPEFGATPYVENQLGWYADLMPLAPGAAVKMDRYLRPHYSGSTVNAAACPGLAFNYTTDAGRTWTAASSTSLWDTEIASLRTLPTGTGTTGPTRFNQAIDYANLATAPLTRRFSVIQALVPYFDGTNVKARVKLGLLDLAAGCSMVETAVLFDGTLQEAQIYGGRPPMAIPGGVLIFSRDLSAGYNGAWQYPARVRFTPNGTSLADRGLLPAKENYMGFVNGYDTKTMVSTMWDGRHSLYVSKDYGLTWRRAGTVAPGVPPNDAPAPGEEQFFLHDFPIVTYLQKNGVPANGMPLTPWLLDSRLPNPPPI